MTEHKSRLGAAAALAAGARTRLWRLEGPGLAVRVLYLFSAALTGALIYLAVRWPSAAQPRPVAATAMERPQAAPPATVLAQQRLAPGSLAAGSLISEGLRGVNAARVEILLAEQTAGQAATTGPPPRALTVSAPPPATQIISAPAPATQTSSAPQEAPAQPVIAPSPSPSMVAEGPQTAPADVGAGTVARSAVPVPNHITIPATVPPQVSPTPTRPR